MTEKNLTYENRAEILSVDEFLSIQNIRIPEYQRPYRWDEKSVIQLIEDVFAHRNKSKYRIGTIVIHINTLNGKTYYDIVDGQQRFTTLRLILSAIHNLTQNIDFDEDIKKDIITLKQRVDNIKIDYSNKESIKNIHQKYLLVKRSLSKYDNKTIHAFLKKCEVVVFYIENITEAFQFFDSQNSRGKDLNPHDLLKAFHLRAFDDREIDRQVTIVNKWESYPSKKLEALFAEYLYRIKGWSNRKSSRWFDKRHIGMFKGINLDKITNYPYIMPLNIVHHFVDNYNSNFERNIDQSSIDYPFQLNQTMINGRRFFEYVYYYQGIIDDFKNKYISAEKGTNVKEAKIISMVHHNQYAYREGEKYIKLLFECCLICYLDKFGTEAFENFVEKAFVWCFILRFKYQRLGFDSLDNYVLGNNIFTAIKDAITAEDVLRFKIKELPKLSEIENLLNTEKKRIDKEIALFFRDKLYYEN
ncbi:DUF262 domain-containing protein [Bacteroidales bacterium OttesenSCG-928-L19]|nr:DUF262 domain-containing protein [Bacteroidales bacterium OttesenSCG-928-L19]